MSVARNRRPGDAPSLFAMPGANVIEDTPPAGWEADDYEDDLTDEYDEDLDEYEDDEPGSDIVPVLNGEIVDDDEWEEYDTRLDIVRAYVTDVITHPHAQIAARNILYVINGAGTVTRRWWESRTPARHERAYRAAEATGNHEAMLIWEERLAAYRQDRHNRRMDLANLPAEYAPAAPKVGVGCVGVLAFIGVVVAIADKKPAEVIVPFQQVGAAVKLMATIAAVSWLPVLLGLPVAAIAALWAIGRHQTADPTWLGTSSDADIDVDIDETTIARALAALRIPQVTEYLKRGLPLQFITPCRLDGRGTYAKLRLPAGVTAERISRRRADLATGLYRLAKEVWPTTGDEAGVLELWIADKGALAEGAGPYPLLEGGFVDVFKGVPFGKTLRGEPRLAPVIGRNTIIGGMPDQGKSSAARDLITGYVLDPTAEIRIWVPDANYDFEVYKRRCSRYVMGAEDAKIEQIRNDLLELHAEVQQRGELLIQYKEPEVTRELADMDIGLHPLVCLLEEAHVAFGHKVYGEEISTLYVDIVKLCRKRGIHMIPSTQAPTKASIPRDITRNCSNGIAFAVGDHHANDALLGQGAYSAGHRATDLIPGTDRGTALVKGFSGERSEMIQAYFLSVARGNDQVTPLIERALAEIERRGKPVPGSDRERLEAGAQARDLLEDLDEVLGVERTRLADIPALLWKLAPTWLPYRNLTGKALRAQLKGLGVHTTNPGNVPVLDPAELRRVLAIRSTEDLDEWG